RGLDPTHLLHPPEAVVAAIGIARTSVRCARCRQVAQLDARLGIDDAEVAGQARKMVVYEGGLVLPDALKPAEVVVDSAGCSVAVIQAPAVGIDHSDKA